MDQFDELKQLLLGPEREKLDEVQQRLDACVVRAEEVADVLPAAIRRGRGEGSPLVEALREPVGHCIKQSVQKDTRIFADALFPVMGPAIRRAIGESLKSTLQSINQVLDQSFSARGLKWRLESIRSGVPFHEVVLHHTLVYRVEQVFLIQPGSGLLMQHVADPRIITQDADAVSAMLTAIGDFMTDSFSNGLAGEVLENVNVGDQTLWLMHGPYGLLACVLRGIPPAGLRDRFQKILEDIHGDFGPDLESFDGDRDSLSYLQDHLERCLVSEQKEDGSKKKGIPAATLILLALLLGGLGWWRYDAWQQEQAKIARQTREAEAAVTFQAKQERLVSALHARPGIVLTNVEYGPDRLYLTGLRDPLASDPTPLIAEAGLTPEEVVWQWRPYQSPEPDIAVQRAVQRLTPPDGVDIRLDEGGLLHIAGAAAPDWIEKARLLALTVPGVHDFDASNLLDRDQDLLRRARELLAPPESVKIDGKSGRLVITGEATHGWLAQLPARLAALQGLDSFDSSAVTVAERRELPILVAHLEKQHLYFDGKVELQPNQEEIFDTMTADLERLLEISRLLELSTRVLVIGHTDGLGSPAYNLQLGYDRASFLIDALVERGLPAELFQAQPAMPIFGRVNQDPQLRRTELRIVTTDHNAPRRAQKQ